MALREKLGGLWAALGATLTATAVNAQTAGMRDGLEIIGAPEPGGVAFQRGVTDGAMDIRAFDNMLL